MGFIKSVARFVKLAVGFIKSVAWFVKSVARFVTSVAQFGKSVAQFEKLRVWSIKPAGPSSGVYSLTLGEGPGLPGGPGRGPREGRGKVRLEKLEKPAKKNQRNNGKRNR